MDTLRRRMLINQEEIRCKNYQQLVAEGKIDKNNSEKSYCDAMNRDFASLLALDKKIAADQATLEKALETQAEVNGTGI